MTDTLLAAVIAAVAGLLGVVLTAIVGLVGLWVGYRYSEHQHRR